VRSNLRGRLTVQFVLLFVILYFTVGAVAIFIFASQLDASLDDELQDLAFEIQPAIDFTKASPSLKIWANRAEARHDKLLSTVQLFDLGGNLIEEFGPEGYRHLKRGSAVVDIKSHDAFPVNVRSRFLEIFEDGAKVGFLQVQVSLKQRDDALRQIVFTMILLSPFLALAVALCGSWFSGNATRPVEETMALLRQFVVDAAHEINTPITVIDASVQTLEETFSEQEQDDDILPIIKRASSRMRALGESLIVLSRMETPEYAFNISRLKLSDVIAPVVAECEQISKRKHQMLVVEPIPDVSIFGHAESLERMFLNLIANAVRYTDDGGQIDVRFSVQDDKLKIIVEDTGVGIPKESLDHVFERFYRVDKSRSREMGGFGLGLSIVKAIVDRHNGTITVESQVGRGSSFITVLPLAA
jgi:two-component system sensor histidine kinase CiaH